MAAQPGSGGTLVQHHHTRASELLAPIFYDILPEYGLVLRENKLSLFLTILEAMERQKVSLCEAEVGKDPPMHI